MATYGETIEKHVQEYIETWQLLNKHNPIPTMTPKEIILTEVRMKVFVWENVLEELEERLS